MRPVLVLLRLAPLQQLQRLRHVLVRLRRRRVLVLLLPCLLWWLLVRQRVLWGRPRRVWQRRS